jgi:transposase
MFIKCPMMNLFPAPNSIVIMNNATVNHGGRIAEICDAANVLLIYLPPYLPDLNPIEKVFLVLKSQVKRHHLLTGTDNKPNILKAHLERMVTPSLMGSLFLGSGYSES